jgi:hypothetical protein
MAERSAKVQERVREELAKNPGASTKELLAAAQSVDSSLGGLSLRQFNAGYVLPLKRGGPKGRKRAKAGAAAGGRGPGKKRTQAAPAAPPKTATQPRNVKQAAPAGDRDRVRATLLEFARDFSAAESRSAIVGVLSNLDRYVDKIVGSRR